MLWSWVPRVHIDRAKARSTYIDLVEPVSDKPVSDDDGFVLIGNESDQGLPSGIGARGRRPIRPD